MKIPVLKSEITENLYSGNRCLFYLKLKVRVLGKNTIGNIGKTAMDLLFHGDWVIFLTLTR